MPSNVARRRATPSLLLSGWTASFTMPSRPRVTLLSGSDRSSLASQKSRECLATIP